MSTKTFSQFTQVSSSGPVSIRPGDFLVGYYYNNADEIRITVNDLSKLINANVIPGAFLPLSGGIVTGNINIGNNFITASTDINYPTAAGHLTNKAYVDQEIGLAIAAAGAGVTASYVQARFLPLSGGTLTGALSVGNNKINATYTATADYDVANVVYVNTAIANAVRTNFKVNGLFLPLSGGAMTGALDLGSNNITSSHKPAANADLTNKEYVDTQISTALNGVLTTGGATTGWVQANFLPLSGGTMSGLVNCTSIPTAVGHLTNKQYVDGKFLPLAGGTITGNIAASNSTTYPTDLSHLTNKAYVDNQIATAIGAAGTGVTSAFVHTYYLPLSGGTMSGSINLGSNNITSTHTPAANADLTNKSYVDTAIQNAAVTVKGGTGITVTSDSNTNTFTVNGASSSAGDTVPIGTVMHFAASTAPAGWFECAGQSLDTKLYSDLFKAIGYTYGGSGNNFNLPDLRGEFVRGWDHGAGVDSGRAFGSKQSAYAGYNTFSVAFDDGDDRVASQKSLFNITINDGFLGTRGLGGNNYSYTGGPINVDTKPGDTRPNNVALLPCIKYAQTQALTQVGLNAQNVLNAVNNLNFQASLSSRGYQKLPSGLIMQWGLFYYTGGGNDSQPVTWNYPIPFPNAVVNINITPQYNGPINGNVVGYVESTSLTNAVVGLDGSAAFGSLNHIPVYISATGY